MTTQEFPNYSTTSSPASSPSHHGNGSSRHNPNTHSQDNFKLTEIGLTGSNAEMDQDAAVEKVHGLDRNKAPVFGSTNPTTYTITPPGSQDYRMTKANHSTPANPSPFNSRDHMSYERRTRPGFQIPVTFTSQPQDANNYKRKYSVSTPSRVPSLDVEHVKTSTSREIITPMKGNRVEERNYGL